MLLTATAPGVQQGAMTRVGKSDSGDHSTSTRVLILFDPVDASELAVRLADDLRSSGYLVRDVAGVRLAGRPESEVIEALAECDVVIVFLTPGAVDKPNGSCLDAIAEAVSVGKRIVPAMVKLCRPPLAIYRLNWLDLQGWRDPQEYASAVQRLVVDVEAVDGSDREGDAIAVTSPEAGHIHSVGGHSERSVRVMISYGRADAAELARTLRSDLTDRGFDVWLDEFELRAGREWEERIEQSILAADVVVALLTPHAVRRPDGVCLDEIAFARSEGRRIVPAMAVVCRPPFTIYRLDWIDFRGWERQDAYATLLDRLAGELQKPGVEIDGLHAHVFGQLGPMDFGPEVARLSRDFTGRQWLDGELDSWLNDDREGRLFFLVGDPGSGKSAFLASVVARHPAVAGYHFCQRTLGDSLDPRRFVCSLAAQLATQFPACNDALQRIDLHDALASDPGVLFRRLVAEPLYGVDPDGPALLVIDALDEGLEQPGTGIAQVLRERLEDLPRWVRLLISSRREPELLEMFARYRSHGIDADRVDNREDIRQFILTKLAEPAAAQRLSANRVAAEGLAAVLVENAAGNFLHAAQAVAAIGDGALDPRQPDRFPRGLADFYSLFFSRTFRTDEAFNAARPLLAVLCASREPLTLERLTSFTLKSDFETQQELERVAAYFPRRGDRYQVFHQSLRDWLLRQASVRYRLDPVAGHKAIASSLWADFEHGSSDRFVLAHLARHLAEAGELERLETLLTAPAFLEAKASAGRVFELVGDFDAHDRVAADARDRGVTNTVARAFGIALRRTQHFVARHPEALFQCLWNLCVWHEAADNTPVRDTLEQWRSDRQPPRWLREMRPPALSLDSPLEGVLGGHEGAVTSVAVSPDGKLIASGGVDGTARIWDQVSGEPIDRLVAGTGQPQGSGKAVAVDESRGVVRAISFSPSGEKLAAAISNGDFIVWDVAEGRELLRVRDPECKRYAVAFSPDAQTVAVGDNLGVVRVIDARSGGEVRTLGDLERANRRRSPPPSSFDAVQLDRDVVVYNSFDDVPPISGRSTRYLGPYDEEEFSAQRLIDLEICITAVAYSRDGSRLASAGWDQRVRIWDPGTGELIATWAGHENWVIALEFSPDGRMLASASNDKTVRVWDMATGEPREVITGHLGPVTGVTFLGDGRTLASCSMDGTVRLWHSSSGEPLGTPVRHTSALLGVAVVNEEVLTACSDGTVCRWSIANPHRQSEQLGHSGRINDIEFAADGSQLFTASNDGSVGVWDTATGSVLTRLRGNGHPVRSLSKHSNGMIASSSSDGTIDLWRGATKIGSFFAGATSEVHLVLDGRRLLAAHLNRITAWNLETGNRVFELNAGAGTLTGAFSSDQRTFACSRWIAPTMSVMQGGKLVTYRAREPEEAGAIVFVFDLETGERRFRWRIGEDANDCAIALALASDGVNLAIATASGALDVIEVATGRHLLDDPGEPAERVQFSPDGGALYVLRAGTVTTYEVSGGGDHAPPEQPRWVVGTRNGEVVLRSAQTENYVVYLDGVAENTTSHPMLPIWAASTGPQLRIFGLEADLPQEIESP